MNCSTPGLPVHYQLPEFTQTHVHRVSDAIQPSHPLSSPSPPAPISLPASESFPISPTFHMRWPKYWSFSFSISPSSEHPGLTPLGWTSWISLQAKGLSSLLQHHNSKASFLWHSAFFIVQLSHPYTTTGRTIALTRQTFVEKVMSLLLNMLSRMVISFLRIF